jgi:hypothetical protein
MDSLVRVRHDAKLISWNPSFTQDSFSWINEPCERLAFEAELVVQHAVQSKHVLDAVRIATELALFDRQPERCFMSAKAWSMRRNELRMFSRSIGSLYRLAFRITSNPLPSVVVSWDRNMLSA